MESNTDMIQLAASFDWEALLPVLFFLLYGISQLFGKKKRSQEGEEAPDEDAMERARQIREEIRRKIEERRQAAGGGESTPEYDPTTPDGQQRNLRPQHAELRPQQGTLEQPVQKSIPMPAPQQKRRMPEPTVSIGERLKEQRRMLEETRRKAKEAQERAATYSQSGRGRQVVAIRQRAELEKSGPKRGRTFRENLLMGLRNPQSLRKAILYQEILEKPVSLK